MKNDCAKYRDQLLEAALTESAAGALEMHLQSCSECTTELATLRARREQMDSLLPLLARGAEPSGGFRTQVLAAAGAAREQKGVRHWRAWVLAGVAAAVAAAAMTGWMLEQNKSRLEAEIDIATAQKLAEWRAPSDVLLENPGNEILRTTPKLGESYLKAGAKMNQEE
jgi:anti-sigma factor RsiW